MQTKHSAIREYSDHLITFQSGFPHVSHQSLQDRGQGSAVRDVQNPTSQEPWHKPTGLLQDPVLEGPAQRAVVRIEGPREGAVDWRIAVLWTHPGEKGADGERWAS